MKRARLTIGFCIKRARVSADNQVPIYVRVTVDGDRKELATNLKTDIKLWNQKFGQCTGKDKLSLEINKRIEIIRVKLMEAYNGLLLQDKYPTATRIFDAYLGVSRKPRPTLIKLFEEHNRKCGELAGKDMAPGTVERYETCLRHVREFMQHAYRKGDIDLCEIDKSFILDFEHYLKTVRNCAHNTTMRYLKNFRKIIKIAILKKYIEDDPYVGFKLSLKDVVRDFLEMDEIEKLRAKDFGMERLNQVRDVYIFCCYSGLAYADVKRLNQFHISKDNGGALWLRIARQKTKSMCNIPLLQPAKEILVKYEEKCGENLLPVLSNQKMNAYLHEISTICGINKTLTTHTARHTFATVVCLANGVSMDNVAKMLGHADTSMTRHYAKVLDRSIMNDMRQVETRLIASASC